MKDAIIIVAMLVIFMLQGLLVKFDVNVTCKNDVNNESNESNEKIIEEQSKSSNNVEQRSKILMLEHPKILMIEYPTFLKDHDEDSGKEQAIEAHVLADVSNFSNAELSTVSSSDDQFVLCNMCSSSSIESVPTTCIDDSDDSIDRGRFYYSKGGLLPRIHIDY